MGSEADDVIELAVGDEHVVTLAGFGTAGYKWAPEIVGDAEVAEVAERAAPALGSGAAVGASASEAFALRAKRPGAVRIRFALRRPWEPRDEPPAKERTIELRVS
jgi:predicted secreted protein